MGLNIFGARRSKHAQVTEDWPRLPGSLQPTLEQRLALAIPPAEVVAETPVSPEQELLERIAGFRGAVADSLYEISKDYRMLCDLTHADLSACDEVVAELRRRLADNLHYKVLANLDEAHALAEAHVTALSAPAQQAKD
jgi:hypothetical protein